MNVPKAIRLQLTTEEYFSGANCPVPYLSQSIANRMLQQSCKHAWTYHPMLGRARRSTTKAMDRGTLLHTMLLGKGKQVDVIDAPNFKTKAAQEARDNAIEGGFIPVLRKDYDSLDGALAAMRANLEAEGVKLGGEPEAMFEWEETADDGTPVVCRGMMDNLFLGEGLIVDLKKCESAHPEACGRHAVDYGYDVQRAAYVSCLEKLRPDLAGRATMQFAFIEMDPPYAVSALPFGGMLIHMGRAKWRRAINMWARCLATNEWPGYARDGALECKPWQMSDEILASAES